MQAHGWKEWSAVGVAAAAVATAGAAAGYLVAASWTGPTAAPTTAGAPLPASIMAQRTVNPIRGVVEKIDRSGHPEKDMVTLALGDPTLFGNFAPPPSANAVADSFAAASANGYTHSAGLPAARKAIAETYSYPDQGNTLSPSDVVIASGASGAIYLAIQALCNEGDNILVPEPGFALYGTASRSCGVEDIKYPLLPEKNWEIDLDALAAKITPRTRAIVVNNPSNPCGSVFTRAHMLDILALAAEFGLPIIADEIYMGMVFDGVEALSFAQLPLPTPVLTISGLAKRYMVPGWRVGWVCVYDVDARAAPIRDALYSLAQITLGACTLIQSAIPSLLQETPESYHAGNNAQLEANATLVSARLNAIPGVTTIAPQGAMYCMCHIDFDAFDDAIQSDMDFVQGLLDEQSVFVLPGSSFNAPQYFRVVFAPPKDKLEVALTRIEEFCTTHAK